MSSSLPKKSNGDIPLGSAPGANNSSFSFQRGSPLSASQISQISDQAARANSFNISQTGLQLPTFSAPSEQFIPRMFFEGILTEDMRASTDPLTDPVVVKMKLLQPTNHVENAGQAAVSFDDYGDEINITNRSTVLTGSSGDYIACARVNNEVRPIPGGGGSSGGKIWFDVISIGYYNGWVLPGCESVLAVVTQVSCETTSVAVGDEVYVYDPSFCFFNLPIVILMNLSGTATLSKRDDLTFTRCGVYMTDACFWAVDSVCCLEEDYGT